MPVLFTNRRGEGGYEEGEREETLESKQDVKERHLDGYIIKVSAGWKAS